MQILLCADFHSDFIRLNRLVRKFNLCICCGDIFDYHHLPDKNFAFPLPFYSIKGNKELWGNVPRTLEDYSNFFWLNEHLDELQTLTGLRFLGIDYLQEPSSIPEDVDVLISHQPAYGLADQCSDPFHTKMIPHCGSKALRKVVDRYQPSFLIAGHVHYYQKQQSGKTLAVTLPPALIDPVMMLSGKELVTYK
ncbi:MAG: metallophosphoesterase [Candidatus Heimdallarchaeota archaeon]|nr:MAG: metallophosphoesterase [Candidatus Heimdallarchaeota archaeon]